MTRLIAIHRPRSLASNPEHFARLMRNYGAYGISSSAWMLTTLKTVSELRAELGQYYPKDEIFVASLAPLPPPVQLTLGFQS